MLGERQNYKSLIIQETDTIKEAERGEKKVSKDYLKRTGKISWKQALQQKSYERKKKKTSGQSFIIWTILKMYQGRSQTNGPK